MSQLPTVGRIVHYVGPNSNQPLAAIINSLEPEFSPECVNLTVFMPDGTTKLAHYVHMADTPTPHYWTWPAR